MALSAKTRARLTATLAQRSLAKEIADAIDASTAKVASSVAAITTADGSDPATTQALANQLKISVNTILAALKTAGLMS